MELTGVIRRIQQRYRYRYGSPRVSEELLQTHGKRVKRKKTAALMRENGLNAFFRFELYRHAMFVDRQFIDRFIT
ncbi:MAG: transposase [Spirochaetaceae bacterium]|nr:transposase [Spirochaetaceae bacterium]